MSRQDSRSEISGTQGVAVVLLIFGMMVLAILGVAVSWEVYNVRVSSVDVLEMQQVYNLAQSGIEFAIGYANDTASNPLRHRAFIEPGQTRTLPAGDSFPGGRFTVVLDTESDTLTSAASLTGSTAKRKTALMNFMEHYVVPDWFDHFEESPDESFDQRYFAGAGGWGAGADTERESVILSDVDDSSNRELEAYFTMAGESQPDIGARRSFFNIGGLAEQEFIVIMPTTPGAGRLRLRDSFDDSGTIMERRGLATPLDAEGYQNYSVEVKFCLDSAPQLDQGFGIVFRLHHPALPLEGPWNKTDLDYTLAYVLQVEPAIGRTPQGGFVVRWWAPDPSLDGRGTETGLCGGAGLFFNEDYCKETKQTPAGSVDVWPGGLFYPERPDYAACDPASPSNPGWGWRDHGQRDNDWYDCDSDSDPDVHKLRVDVIKDRFTVYFGTEHGIQCDDNETERFLMHKIMEIDVSDERARRGACVPDYKAGHIGLRAWNGFQARVDYVKVWRW